MMLLNMQHSSKVNMIIAAIVQNTSNPLSNTTACWFINYNLTFQGSVVSYINNIKNIDSLNHITSSNLVVVKTLDNLNNTSRTSVSQY